MFPGVVKKGEARKDSLPGDEEEDGGVSQEKVGEEVNLFEQLANKDRYDEYKRRIDPKLVLDHYGAKNSYEIQTGDGIEVQHSCLIDQVDPHHTNGDQNPSARMNLEKKLYVCYTYGGGDIFWLIRTMEGKESFTDIIPILGKFLTGSTESKEDFLEELEGYFSTQEGDENEPIPTYSDRVLKQWSVTHPYLINERKVSHEAASRLRVGYDHDERRIVFPLFFEGKLVGWQKRSVPDGLGYPPTLPDMGGYLPKYKNTPGFPKSRALYNYDLALERGREEVLVVESPMSCLKAESLTDGDDILSGTISTLGAKVSDTQVSYLRRFKRVFVYFDSDPAGQKGAQYLTERLYRHTNCVVVDAEEGKDLADYESREEVLSVIENRSSPAFLKLAEWGVGNERKRHAR